MKKLNFKAFTLVEVLIVIIIVGILIAALLPRLTGSQARARDLSRNLAVTQTAAAIDLLLTEDGSLATSGVICLTAVSAIESAEGANIGSYLDSSKLPDDPSDLDLPAIDGVNCAAGVAAVIVSTDGQKAVVVMDAETAVAANVAITTSGFSSASLLDAWYETNGQDWIAAETTM